MANPIDNPNEDTEFNDALRKHGILPPLPKPPRTPTPPPSPTLSDLLEDSDYTKAELRELAEDAGDDEAESINEFARRREAEERREGKLARFGRVYPIGREDYTREVTEASAVNEPGVSGSRSADDDEESDSDSDGGGRNDDSSKKGKGPGTGVVCLLYAPAQPASERTASQLSVLAARHPRTKFVSIVGDKCIPNLPASRCPMLIVYRGGEIRQQVVGWGADRERSVDELELLLIVSGAIIPPERPPPTQRKDDASEEEDSDFEESRRRSAATSTNGRSGKNIRSGNDRKKKKGDDDSDSDFDFDL
ncbi:Phosducin domain-containing protein [Favolaschia claudopus]|uniref:Phosducin domain-containing protein n=1 Tax=Favolaschia claudopus TaxID=2862362 RepID=A0AAW0AZ48_9AGAR